MGTFSGGLASGYVLRLDTWNAGQSQGGNYTNVSWHLHIIKGSGSGKWADGPHYWSVNIGGHTASGSIGSYDFRAYSDLSLGSGTFSIGHDGSGNLTMYSSAGWNDNDTWGELGDSSCGGYDSWPRIPKPPTAPAMVQATPQEAGKIYVQFTGASVDNMGAAIDAWELQVATNSGFTTGVQNISSGGTTTYQGVPGTTYWFRSRGHNSAGWGAYSGSLSAQARGGGKYFQSGSYKELQAYYYTGGQWKTVQPMYYTGGVWKTLG